MPALRPPALAAALALAGACAPSDPVPGAVVFGRYEFTATRTGPVCAGADTAESFSFVATLSADPDTRRFYLTPERADVQTGVIERVPVVDTEGQEAEAESFRTASDLATPPESGTCRCRLALRETVDGVFYDGSGRPAIWRPEDREAPTPFFPTARGTLRDFVVAAPGEQCACDDLPCVIPYEFEAKRER